MILPFSNTLKVVNTFFCPSSSDVRTSVSDGSAEGETFAASGLQPTSQNPRSTLDRAIFLRKCGINMIGKQHNMKKLCDYYLIFFSYLLGDRRKISPFLLLKNRQFPYLIRLLEIELSAEYLSRKLLRGVSQFRIHSVIKIGVTDLTFINFNNSP